MNTNNENINTSSEASETPEPTVGGRCLPQVSSSPSSIKSVEVTRQVSTASKGAGRTTAGELLKRLQEMAEAEIIRGGNNDRRISKENPNGIPVWEAPGRFHKTYGSPRECSTRNKKYKNRC